MKNSIRLQLEQSASKMKNLEEQAYQIGQKIDRLRKELDKIEKSLEREEQNFSYLGLKQVRRDQVPETPEEIQKKEEYNSALIEEKFKILRENNLEEDTFAFMPKLASLARLSAFSENDDLL